MLIVLRVYGSHIDVEACMQWLRPYQVEEVWRVGDIDLLGRTSGTSGFNVLLHESEDPKDGLQEAMIRFGEMSSEIEELVRAGASAELDIGIFIGASSPRSIEIGASTMSAISRVGATVVFTAYPVSDDEDAE